MLLSGIDGEPFHPDEAHKISETYYYTLFPRGELSHPDWHTDFYSRTNPPVGKYVMGAGLALQGHRVTDPGLQERFDRLWGQPAVFEAMVPRSLLLAGRRISAAMGAMVCLLVYFLGRMAAGPAVGALAVLALLCNPLFVTCSRLAMTDSILMVFMTASVVAVQFYGRCLCLETADRCGGTMTIGPARMILTGGLVPGAAIGLAAGTKLSGGLAAVFYLAAMTGLWAMRRLSGHQGETARQKAAFAPVVLVAGAVAAGLFIGLNPYLHTGALPKMIAVFKAYDGWMLKQMVSPGDPLLSWSQKVAAPYFYHFVLPEMALHVRPERPPLSASFILFVSGVGYWLVAAASGFRQRRVPANAALHLAWVVVYAGGMTAWSPLGWLRYYMPLCPLVAVTMAAGVAGWARVLRIVARRWAGRAVAPELEGWDRRRITGFALTVVLLASLGTAGVRLSSLPPSIIANFAPARLADAYSADIQGNRDPANALFNLADLMVMVTVPAIAADLYLLGLDKIGKADHDAVMAKTAAVQAKAIGALMATGDTQRAYPLWRCHLALLETIRGRLGTDDPKVREAFDRMIAESRAGKVTFSARSDDG